jgi:hypothetical protein
MSRWICPFGQCIWLLSLDHDIPWLETSLIVSYSTRKCLVQYLWIHGKSNSVALALLISPQARLTDSDVYPHRHVRVLPTGKGSIKLTWWIYMKTLATVDTILWKIFTHTTCPSNWLCTGRGWIQSLQHRFSPKWAELLFTSIERFWSLLARLDVRMYLVGIMPFGPNSQNRSDNITLWSLYLRIHKLLETIFAYLWIFSKALARLDTKLRWQYSCQWTNPYLHTQPNTKLPFETFMPDQLRRGPKNALVP